MGRIGEEQDNKMDLVLDLRTFYVNYQHGKEERMIFLKKTRKMPLDYSR